MSAAVVVLLPVPATTTMSGIFRAQAFTLELPRAGENLVIRIRVSVPVNEAVLSGGGASVSTAVSRTGGNVVTRVRVTRSRVPMNGTVLSGEGEVVLVAIPRTGENWKPLVQPTSSKTDQSPRPHLIR